MTQQNWNAAEYAKHAAFVPTLAHEVLSLLAPRPGEVILDLGCGDGELTHKLQQQGCEVTGIDASPGMVERASSRGLHVYVMDGHKLPFQNQFDAVFSNAALHWLTQPEQVLEGVHRALKANGRFVAEFGAQGNIAALLQAMREVFAENPDFGRFRMPWFFPSAEEYAALLELAGFRVDYIESIPRPTPLKSGVEKWLEIFAAGITTHLNPQQKRLFMGNVQDKLVSVLYSEQDGWVADYVRLRFAATKK